MDAAVRTFLDENLNGLVLLHIQEPDDKLMDIIKEFFDTVPDTVRGNIMRYLLATPEGIDEFADEMDRVVEEMGGADTLLPTRDQILKEMYKIGTAGLLVDAKDKLAALKEYATLKGMYQKEEVADHLPNHIMYVPISGSGSVEDWEKDAIPQQTKVQDDAAASEKADKERAA